LSAGSREGNILDVSIFRNVKETEAAKERVSELFEKSKNKNTGCLKTQTVSTIG
jgi:hypothetical protein